MRIMMKIDRYTISNLEIVWKKVELMPIRPFAIIKASKMYLEGVK